MVDKNTEQPSAMSGGPVAVALLSLVLAAFTQVSPSVAQQSESHGEQGGTLLWTTVPQRVKPSEQALPRLPGRAANEAYPEKIYVPQSVRVTDSITFVLGGSTFRLTGVKPVPPHYVCQEANGKRWSCGLRARTSLRALIAGKAIECKTIKKPGDETVLVDCETSTGLTLARTLLLSGFAVPTSEHSVDFSEAVLHAVTTRAGIWSDEAFFTKNSAVAETR